MTEAAVDLPSGWVTYGRRLTQLAEANPDGCALVFAADDGGERIVTWRELDALAAKAAHLLDTFGAGPGRTVAIGLPNCVEHIAVTWGAWKAGATVVPIRHDLPSWERNRLLAVVEPVVAVARWPDAVDVTDALHSSGPAFVGDRLSNPARAIASGGSTGQPKLIRTPAPAAGVPGALGAMAARLGWAPGQVRLIPGPLYHMSPFVMAFSGVFEAMPLVVMERFEAGRALDLIGRHRVEHSLMVPTMLYRMAREPGVTSRDLSSIVSIVSGGAKLAPWLWRAWIDLLGAERVWEAYGATEAHGNTYIRGDEWLSHPGSVGRPQATILRICDDSGREVAPGTIGEIYMRPEGFEGPTFEYVGAAAPRRTGDGLVSVGDLGWVDDEGYLFVADRRVDMVVTGGANVFPAEVEAALSEHTGVADVAVIGLPDDEWGTRVHAIVEPRDGGAPPAEHELAAHARARLAPYKVPKSFEMVERLPRNDVGKLMRAALVEARADGRREEGLR